MRRPIPIDEDLLRTLWPDRSVTLAEIAHRLGCSLDTVRSRARSLGLPQRGQPHAARTAEDEALLRTLYADEELPVTRIAERLGRSAEVVWGWARQLDLPGVETRAADRVGRQRDAERRELVALWHDRSRTTAQIAEILGVTIETVSRRARRYGLPDRRATPSTPRARDHRAP